MASPEVAPVMINERAYRTVREGQASILAPYQRNVGKTKRVNEQSGQPRNNDEGDQAVFYNPIQQYNRDLSVLAILVYGESAIEAKQLKHKRNINRSRQKGGSKSKNTNEQSVSPALASKKRKFDDAALDHDGNATSGASKKVCENNSNGAEEPEVRTMDLVSSSGASNADLASEKPEAAVTHERPDPVSKTDRATPFTILDALSASGLRAIRYAKEIPFSTIVVANDVSPDAVEAIKLNIEHNKLTDRVFAKTSDARQFMYSKTGNESAKPGPGYVHKFDVVDLDPYGTAASFLDAAIQAVTDGGMLCITCTDAGVWASNGYPEKAFALYAGIPVKGPHSHEAGLRLILHSLSTSASKYGIAIEPLLSLSIDFYARLFVRVHKSQQDVKLLAGTTMLLYNCDQGCGAWETQLVAKNQEKKAKNGDSYFKHGFSQAPSADKYCQHCGTKSHLGGPMWAGPLHNPVFIQKILDKLPNADRTIYGTTDRIRGMLTVALEEEDIQWSRTTRAAEQNGSNSKSLSAVIAVDATSKLVANIPRMPPHLLSPSPLFFLPTYLAKVLALPTPSDDALRGAILGLGYNCTRSHCKPGSYKTNAPWAVLWEIMREFARQKEKDRIPRLLGEGEFEGKASVKRSSPGWNILKRLRDRNENTVYVARIVEGLKAKLGFGNGSAAVETASDLQSLLTSALYELEHPPTAAVNSGHSLNSGAVPDKDETLEAGNRQNVDIEAATDADVQPFAGCGIGRRDTTTTKISGKALIDGGGDPSELEIIFDTELGRASRESKGGRLVRYQINPRANWGPMVRAGTGITS